MEIRYSNKAKLYKKIDKAIIKYNYKKSKNDNLNPKIYKRKIKNEGFYLYDEGTLVGGTGFYIDEYNWIYIDILFIKEKYRRSGYGTKLIENIVEYAKIHKCTGIKAETWNFQAKPFYEKKGFELYGILKDHPKGLTCYLLAMHLD